MSFHRIGPKQQRPDQGDIFALQITDIGVLFGRVVSTDTIDGPFGRAFDDSTLIYLYKYVTTEADQLPEDLTIDALLCEPLIIGSSLWSSGFAKRVGHREPEPGEVLRFHCFKSESTGKYFNEYGDQLAEETQPCGQLGVTTLYGIDQKIRHALDLPTEVDFE